MWILCDCSVTKSRPTLCDPLNCSTSGFPVLCYLPEFAQTHVHWVSDGIQPPHPLLPLTPLALNHSQHQGLFQWISSSNPVAKLLEASASASVLPMSTQSWFPLGLTGWISLLSSPTLQFESINSSVLSLLYGPTLTSIHDYRKNYSFDYTDLCQQCDVSIF